MIPGKSENKRTTSSTLTYLGKTVTQFKRSGKYRHHRDLRLLNQFVSRLRIVYPNVPPLWLRPQTPSLPWPESRVHVGNGVTIDIRSVPTNTLWTLQFFLSCPSESQATSTSRDTDDTNWVSYPYEFSGTEVSLCRLDRDILTRDVADSVNM